MKRLVGFFYNSTSLSNVHKKGFLLFSFFKKKFNYFFCLQKHYAFGGQFKLWQKMVQYLFIISPLHDFTDQYLSKKNRSALSCLCTEIFCHKDEYFFSSKTGYTFGAYCKTTRNTYDTPGTHLHVLVIFLHLWMYKSINVLFSVFSKLTVH